MCTLGDKVKDPVTGIEDIAYWRTQYLQGCDRIGIQPPAIKEKGKETIIPKVYEVDEPQLIVVKKGAITPAVIKGKATGGPSGVRECIQARK